MPVIDQLLGIALHAFGLFLQLLLSFFTFIVVAIEGMLHFLGVR